ncbi:hypothetical protein [Demequina salsinemoris]|uniref:hypothetical protein n=1 Tax=Demequina salsinemoris TaxID=577470 RepID=UPI0007821F66|nr:hypothetical protein [Demequina salsinemoris]
MSIEKTRREVTRLRAEFTVEPRESALRLAQRLSWYSMELALAKDYKRSEEAWEEAYGVARCMLEGGGPTQYERTELIRIGVGTAHALLLAGRQDDASAVVDETERQYDRLVAQADDPSTVLALRGPILGVRAEMLHDQGDREAEIEAVCESILEMLAGSEASPAIVNSMVKEPLRRLHALVVAGDDV